MRTLEEIKEQLKQLEETVLLEVLGLSSEDLVDRFGDLIEDNFDKFEYELEQWFPSDDETPEN